MPKGKDVLAIMLGGKPKGKEGPSPEASAPPEKSPTGLPGMTGPEGPEGLPEEEGPLDSEYSDAFAESAVAAMVSLQVGDVEGFASSLKDAIITCVEEQNSGEY